LRRRAGRRTGATPRRLRNRAVGGGACHAICFFRRCSAARPGFTPRRFKTTFVMLRGPWRTVTPRRTRRGRCHDWAVCAYCGDGGVDEELDQVGAGRGAGCAAGGWVCDYEVSRAGALSGDAWMSLREEVGDLTATGGSACGDASLGGARRFRGYNGSAPSAQRDRRRLFFPYDHEPGIGR
jgi:hypothetical protein